MFINANIKCWIFGLFFPLFSFCQSSNSIVSPGMYSGSLIYSNAFEKGYYFFKKDSAFLYFQEDEKAGIIKKVGIGIWSVKNKKLYLKFEKFETHSLYYGTEYEAEANSSTDSSVINIDVLDNSLKPISYASIYFEGTNKGGLTDSNGRYNSRRLGLAPITLIISKAGFHPRKFTLNSNLNKHSLRTVLKDLEQPDLQIIKSSKTTSHSFVKTKNTLLIFTGNLALKRENGKINHLVSLISKTILADPENKSILEKVLLELKSE